MILIDRVSSILEILSSLNPDPKTELYYINAYTLLVAVVLSAQSTDKGVNLVTRTLFISIDSAQKMIDFGEENLRDSIKSIGLFPTKAKNIMAFSRMLLEKWSGKIPSTFEDLTLLPGVGAKSANVILNTIFSLPTIPVDTHVFRVSHRLGLSKAKTRDLVEKDLHKIIPPKYKLHAHNLLVLHGRYICKARYPLCQTCPLQSVCPSFPL